VKLPANYNLAYSAELIAKRIAQLGEQIGEWAAQGNDQVLAVCVLRGGAPFFQDLIREVPVSLEPAYCRTWSYSSESNIQQGNGVRVAVESVLAEGRRLLVVDDICDSGATLLKLQNVFTELGAKEIKTAVLIHRRVERSVYDPTWSAFEYHGEEWFVGFGMEDRNHYSNLPAVYTILPK
jgi:hypoxanthine phosphoribosyltransferase